MFQAALEVGKRVRSETELGTRPMSVASAGVKLAERIFGKLGRRTALVLGAGTISEQVVAAIARSRHRADLLMMNRSRERAEKLADRISRHGGAVGRMGRRAASSRRDRFLASPPKSPSWSAATLERAMAARGNRALFIMDLGLPRNIEPAAAETLQRVSL